MKKLAVFASGSGTNFEAIARACAEGRIDAQVALLVCDKREAGVIARAQRLGVEVMASLPKDYHSKADYERAIADRLDGLGVDLICLAGYMRLIGEVLLKRYGGRIVNIHPSLLPAFKGAHAIQDAFDYGVKVYGVTIHFVDETLDGGRIIAQRAFGYEGGDIEEVERRIHAIEHDLYTDTINKLLSENTGRQTE